MAFWATEMGPTNGDPKRKFRFTVQFEGLSLATDQSGVLWHAKTVTKPSFTITETDHTFLDKKYYYPGRVEWQTVAFTLVDPADGEQEDAVRQMNQIIKESGYIIPKNASDAGMLETISKGKANKALGQVIINQIDHKGKTIESWKLNNVFVTEMKFGDLDYTGDELIELSLTVRYDWATCTIFDKNGAEVEKFYTTAS